VARTTARCTASLVGINFKTGLLLSKIKRAHYTKQEAGLIFDGKVEVDDSYSGRAHKRQRGHRQVNLVL